MPLYIGGKKVIKASYAEIDDEGFVGIKQGSERISFNRDNDYLAVDNADFQINNENLLKLGDSNNSNYVSIKSPSTLNSGYTLTLPSSSPINGQQLTSNASGVFSWQSTSSNHLADTDFAGLLSADVLVYDSTAGSGGAWVNQAITGDISIDASGYATIQPDSVALGTDTTGQYASTIIGSANEIEVTTANSDDATAYTIGLPTDVTITGDLTINGTMSTNQSTITTITDTMVQYADGNISNNVDIGFYPVFF